MRPRVAPVAVAVLAVVHAIAVRAEPFSASPPPPPRAPWRASVLPEQWRPGVPRSPALDVPSPITRDDEVEQVTLKQAIGLALENNPGIAAQRLEPTRVEQGIL